MPSGRWFAVLILCGQGAGALALIGCAATEQARSGSVQMGTPLKAPPMTQRQLQQALMSFADRFVTRIEQATDELAQDTTDPELRQRAMATKYYPALAVVTIAVEPDPEAALLDMVAVVTLERAVWRTGWAEEAFGDRAPRLLMAHDQLEQDIWSVAAKVLNEDQQKLLRDLIEKYLREHPEQRYVSNVRFDNFTALRDRALQRPTALIKLNLVVVGGADEAAQAVVDARLFAERAMFLAARMPMLMSWQVQLLLYELALAPEVRQSLDNANLLTASVHQLSSDLNLLPQRTTEEIDRTLSMIDERHEKLAAIIAELRAGLNDAQQLTVHMADVAGETAKAAEALDQAVQSTDRLVARFQSREAAPAPGTPGQPQSRPFDIKEYTQAICELATTAKELNTLAQQTDTLFATPAWQQRLGDVDRAAAQRLDQFDSQAHGWVDAAFARVIWLIVIASAAALVTALVFRRITRPGRA